MDLHGASVLLTGGSGGLGSLVAARLAGAGARLVLVGRDGGRLAAVASEPAWPADAPRPVLHPADLRLPGTPAEAVAAAVAAHGRLDGLVHAAGVVAFGPVGEADDDLLDELLLVNYLAPVRLLRAALPHLQEQRGFAATISAVVAEAPVAGMAAYSAAKAAMTAFDAAAAKELRRDGVRVLDVRPPHTETGLAGRPIAGTAPRLPRGLDPAAVADRIVRAILDDERDLPSSAFTPA